MQSDILSLDLFANGTAMKDLVEPIQLTLVSDDSNMCIFGRTNEEMVYRRSFPGVCPKRDHHLCHQPFVDFWSHSEKCFCGPGMQQCRGHFFRERAAELGESAVDLRMVRYPQLDHSAPWGQPNGQGS